MIIAQAFQEELRERHKAKAKNKRMREGPIKRGRPGKLLYGEAAL